MDTENDREEIRYLTKERCVVGKIPARQAETEKTAWNMLEHNRVDGVAGFEYYYFNDTVCFRYDVSAYRQCISYTEKQEIDFETAYFLCSRIFKILETGSGFFLKEKDFLFKPEWIFWDRYERRILLCYIPGRIQEKKRELEILLEYFMQRVCHQDKNAVKLVYGVYDLLASETPVEEILHFIETFSAGEKGGVTDKKETGSEGQEHKKQKLEKSGMVQRTEPLQCEGEKNWYVGRAADSDIRLPYMTISRKHLQLILQEGDIYLMDLSSKNGTRLNGKKLVPFQKVRVRKSDKIQIAEHFFSLQREGEKVELIKSNRFIPKFSF